MEWKLTPVAQQKLVQIADFQLKVQRLHGLVEQYATAKTNPQLYEGPIKRASEQLKILFNGSGFGAMAQAAGGISIALRRSGAAAGKARVLRELVGTMRSQLETEQRITMAEGRHRAPQGGES